MELDRRLISGELSNDQVKDVVALALELQGDPKRQWNDVGGQIIEKARVNGLTSDKQWQRYLDQAFDFGLAIEWWGNKPDQMTVRIAENSLSRISSYPVDDCLYRMAAFSLTPARFRQTVGIRR